MILFLTMLLGLTTLTSLVIWFVDSKDNQQLDDGFYAVVCVNIMAIAIVTAALCVAKG